MRTRSERLGHQEPTAVSALYLLQDVCVSVELSNKVLTPIDLHQKHNQVSDTALEVAVNFIVNLLKASVFTKCHDHMSQISLVAPAGLHVPLSRASPSMNKQMAAARNTLTDTWLRLVFFHILAFVHPEYHDCKCGVFRQLYRSQ